MVNYSAKVPSSAVLELTTETRKADSRCGKQLSEVGGRDSVLSPLEIIVVVSGGNWQRS